MDPFPVGSPALITELDKVYGSDPEKENITFREFPDVSNFLEAKEKWEKKASQAKLLFD